MNDKNHNITANSNKGNTEALNGVVPSPLQSPMSGAFSAVVNDTNTDDSDDDEVNRHTDTVSNDKDDISDDLNIQHVFDAAVTYLRDTIEIGSLLQKHLSTEQQLQLYGLYKQVTTGICITTSSTGSNDGDSSTSSNMMNATSSSSSSSLSWWNIGRIRDQTKQRAWDSYRHLTRQQAMTLYVQSLMEWTSQYEELQSLHQFLLSITTTTIITTPNADSIKNHTIDSNSIPSTETDIPVVMKGTAAIPIVSTVSYGDKSKPTPLNNDIMKRSSKIMNTTCNTTILSDVLGISPLQPRGTLDIDYTDLWFAVRQCIQVATIYASLSPKQHYHSLYRTYENDICQRWMQALREQPLMQQEPQQQLHPTSDNTHIGSTDTATAVDDDVGMVVGLSVRSLLDLYLQVQQYPPHSEIIISPPITVPAIMTVLEYHQIQCVCVDLPKPSSSSTTSHNENDEDEDVIISIDVDGIQKAVTSKTVAVMIVHVFGMIVASDEEMLQLRTMIVQSNPSIDILEDCAECFTGLLHTSFHNAYLGSPHADISLFSFGMIKNRTAIQGGIAIVRNISSSTSPNHNNNHNHHHLRHVDLITSMNRLQLSYGLEQSNMKFLLQICKVCMLKWISESPLMYGLIHMIVSGIGLNFDTTVTTLLRGFPMDRTQMMHRIRQRPSLAMLALLRRRLYQPPSTSSIIQRMKYCQTLTDRIIQERRNGLHRIRTLAPKKDCEHYYWLYPILVIDRVTASKHMRQCGFDATDGISQLCCIASPTICPIANKIMSSILYLPIDARGHDSDDNSNKLIRSLRSSMQSTSNFSTTSVTSDVPTNRIRKTRIRCIVICILLMYFCWCFIAVTILVFQLITVLVAIYTTLIWLLRIEMGSFYVESSKGFAKYSYLLNATSEIDQETNHASSDNSKATGLLAGMESLQIPLASSGTKKRSVLLTGATGFVGSMLLRDLLSHRKELHIKSVIVLCRAKKGKTAAERVESLLDDGMFSFLSDDEKRTLVKVIEGDIVLPLAGLSDETISYLVQQTCVTHIFNCAASVSFTQSLTEAATSNILSSLNVQCLGTRITKERIQFVHVSTAFVHGGCCGSNGEPLSEGLFSFGQFHPMKIYSSMIATQFYASKAMNELSFPNTYAFSKCVAEHLLLINDPSTIIIRPSIIGPAVEFPYEGWAGRTPSTIVAAACLYLSYQWNIWSFGRHLVPIIPVDVVSRFVISKAFCASQSEKNETCTVYESSSDESYEKVSHCSSSRCMSSTSSSDREIGYHIFNATWDVRSPRSSGFTWFEYAGAVTQVGCVTGFFNRSTAYLGLMVATKLIPRMKLTTHRFATIHDWCVKHPFDWMTQIRSKFGFSTSHMKRLYSYLNLPLLFYPFMNNSYHFQSELIAPSDLSGEHYLMICVSTAYHFIQKSQNHGEVRNQNAKEHEKYLSLLSNVGMNGNIRGPSILWTIAQPYGNVLVRITAWMLLYVLKQCFSEISVDVQSFAPAMLDRKETGLSCTILAPTHRSIFDSLILTLICFSIPELQIEMPSIAAADLFERIPFFGWLLHFLGAFFVQRGRMSVDPNLMESVSAAKAKSISPVVELFVEGTRSRDRRFLQPKTGVLRCIHDPCYQQTIVPIVINYERIAEQKSFVTEASGGVPSVVHLPAMISWLSVS